MSYVYDPNHGPSRQNVDNAISNYYQFVGNAPAIPTSPVTYLDASNDQKTSEDSISASTLGTGIGAYFAGPAGAAVGNIIGTGLSHLSNEGLQDNQLRNQIDLQRRAYLLNDAAVRNQAQNEVIGMRNAGLNPAAVNGQGAPSLQAGAAAGANSQVSNIFAGMADMILAAKAPTEIERMSAEADLARAQATKATAETGKVEAETGKIGAETEQITDYQNPLMEQQLNKLLEDITAAKNTNDLFKSQQDFLKAHTPTLFNQMKEKYKKDGTWNKMSPEARKRIESLANGDIPLDQGALEGFNKLLDAEVGISDADKQIMSNGLATNVLAKQLKDKGVLRSLAKMPEAQYNKIQSDMAEIAQHIKNMKTSREREEYQIDYDWVVNKLRELDNPTYLHLYGTWPEEKQKFIDDNWKDAKDVIKGVVQMGAAAGVGGAIGGKVAGKAAQQANKPIIVKPTEADMRKFGKTNEPTPPGINSTGRNFYVGDYYWNNQTNTLHGPDDWKTRK